jgi:hypothetical protein
MRTHSPAKLLLFYCVAIAGMRINAQQPPKSDRAGNPVSIVRNDTTNAATIEFRTNNDWRQLKLEAGKDATVAGDRIRVATTREDKATITVDLPIQAGKKYQLIWNTQANIWDFSSSL